MTSDHYHVERASSEDAEAVWQIRFHPDIIKTAGASGAVDLKSHLVWFSKMYLTQADNHCFVLKNGQQVIGYCRFDTAEKGYVISIALHPEQRGYGLGQVLLEKSLAILKSEKPIYALIKPDNLASKAFFQKNHFALDRVTPEGEWYCRYAV